MATEQPRLTDMKCRDCLHCVGGTVPRYATFPVFLLIKMPPFVSRLCRKRMRPDEIVNGRPTRNLKTGRFLKGHVPHTAGKKWDDWMTKDQQKKCLEAGMKNLRPNPNVRGWNRRAIVAVDESGKYLYCESAEKAAQITGLCARNIRACCKGKRIHCGKWRWFYFDSNDWVKFVNEKRNDGFC